MFRIAIYEMVGSNGNVVIKHFFYDDKISALKHGLEMYQNRENVISVMVYSKDLIVLQLEING